jgi:hypothetical protein
MAGEPEAHDPSASRLLYPEARGRKVRGRKVKLSLCLMSYTQGKKTYGDAETYLHHSRSFSTSALDGGEWSAIATGRFTLRYPVGYEAGPMAGCNAVERREQPSCPWRELTPPGPKSRGIQTTFVEVLARGGSSKVMERGHNTVTSLRQSYALF